MSNAAGNGPQERLSHIPAEVERLTAILQLLPRSREEIGRKMHESWSQTKRTQGFHGPGEGCRVGASPAEVDPCRRGVCGRLHNDLIPWDLLPESQKDINRHALDAILGPVLDALERLKDNV